MTDRTCTVEDCDRPLYARGHCNRHYLRMRAHGSVDLPPRPSDVERFWSKVDKSGECWLWTDYVSPKGYGLFFDPTEDEPGRRVLAHRFAHERFVGPIPDGYEVDHVAARGCRFRHCVRPDHLEAVTPEENTRRGNSPGAVVVRTGVCARGHALTEQNTYVAPSTGARTCRECRRLRESRRVRSTRDGVAVRS